MEELLALFLLIAPLSQELEEYLRKITKPRIVSRKEIIMREGEIAKSIYFIEKGLVRSYYSVGKKEVCSWFMKENDVFVSVQSFFLRVPSLETIEALEDCVLWGITYEQLQHAYKTYIEFNYHRGYMLERYYSQAELRHYMTRGRSSAKRYEKLMANEPHLLQRVPAKYLASYLGMTEATFSRTKSKYAKSFKANKKEDTTNSV